jgi:prepilin-type processing-associated H-X9-DG protein
MYANDNADAIPHDGMGSSGLYPDTTSPFNGSHDLNQWFNLLPQLVSDKPLYTYTANAGSSTAYNATTIPFPGGLGKIWQCPSSTMSGSDMSRLSGQGGEGFFSYGMNIDLKGQYNANTGGSSTMRYPQMPKVSTLPKPSAVVLMLDMAFNSTEWPYNNTFYSVNPAGRWRVFAERHNNKQGSILAFVDGHSRYFKWSYVYNQKDPTGRELILGDIIWDPSYRSVNP